MSLEENISHCFREYPKMKLRIEILEEENQQLWAEVARLREALVNIGQARIVNSTELQRIARAALEVKP